MSSTEKGQVVRRRWKVLLFVLISLAGTGAGLWWYAGRVDASPVENWVREYLVKVLREHLNPQVAIGELDYQYPLTVVITELKLTESEVDILAVKRARLELAEIPKYGKPILIERIELDSPSVQLVQTPTERLRGWSNLVRQNVLESEESVESGYRVSDFLRLRQASIRDGSVSHQSAPDAAKMTLDGLNAQILTPPSTTEPGWYSVSGEFTRDGLFIITLDSRINVDDGKLVLNELSVEGQVDRSRYTAFPGPIQEFLGNHKMKGELSLNVSGRWSPAVVEEQDLRLQARLSDVQFVDSGLELTGKQLDATAAVDSQRIVADAQSDLLGGELKVHFESPFEAKQPTGLKFNLKGADLAQLVMLTPESVRDILSQYNIAGRVTGEVESTLPGADTPFATQIKAQAAPLTVKVQGIPVETPGLDVVAEVSNGQYTLTLESAQIGLDKRLSLSAFKGTVTGGDETTKIVLAFGALNGRGEATIDLDSTQPDQIRFAAKLNGVPVEQLLPLISPDFSSSGRAHVVGPIDLTLDGVLNRNDWRKSTCKAQIALTNGRIEQGSESIALQAVNLTCDLVDGRLRVDCKVSAAGGTATAVGDLTLGSPIQANFSGELRGLAMETLLTAIGVRPIAVAGAQPVANGRVSGKYNVKLASANWQDADATFNLTAVNSYWPIGQTRVPLDLCDFNATVRNRRLDGKVQVRLLGGNVRIDTSLTLDAPRAFEANWRASDIRLEKLSGLADGTGPSHYRGILEGEGSVAGQFVNIGETLEGRGRIGVTQGHLLEFPVISDIARVLNPHLSFLGKTDKDEAKAEYTLHPKHVELQSFEVMSSAVAIRGAGRIGFDQSLDLRVRAGVIPKVTAVLGAVDKLLDDLNKKLASYRVRGTIQSPSVQIDALGLSGLAND